jgi:choice-of-anchor A domain-containing protein
LAQAVQDARQASMAIAALSPTQSFGNIQGNGNTTLTGNGGYNVIDVQSIKLSGKGSLTLSGGPQDHFQINVFGPFSLSGSSAITTTGGVLPFNVVFNALGQGKINFSGPSTVDGTILAPDRSFSIGPGRVYGSVIAGGKDLDIHSGAEVVKVAHAPEPSSLSLLAIGSLGSLGSFLLGAPLRRRFSIGLRLTRTSRGA